MRTEKDIFGDYLSRHNLRDTPQRELILDAFLKREEHVSAEELYDIVKTTRPLLEGTGYPATCGKVVHLSLSPHKQIPL